MFEGKTFEYDPGYDPERLDGGGDNTESTPERNREVTPLIINVDCPEYSVTSENPYRYDANPPRPLDTIAATIEAPIRQHFMGRNILLRGIQSAHFGVSDRQQLIKEIVARGGDSFTVQSADPTYDMHARRCDNYSGEEIFALLQAFHTYKPKCDELPLVLISGRCSTARVTKKSSISIPGTRYLRATAINCGPASALRMPCWRSSW